MGEFQTYTEKMAAAPRRVNFHTMIEERILTIAPVDGVGEKPDGEISVPYLSWQRAEDGRLALVLDHRLGVDLPAMEPWQEDSIIEFIANAIAIGAGYASIYYTKRKLPFRG